MHWHFSEVFYLCLAELLASASWFFPSPVSICAGRTTNPRGSCPAGMLSRLNARKAFCVKQLVLSPAQRCDNVLNVEPDSDGARASPPQKRKRLRQGGSVRFPLRVRLYLVRVKTSLWSAVLRATVFIAGIRVRPCVHTVCCFVWDPLFRLCCYL